MLQTPAVTDNDSTCSTSSLLPRSSSNGSAGTKTEQTGRSIGIEIARGDCGSCEAKRRKLREPISRPGTRVHAVSGQLDRPAHAPEPAIGRISSLLV